jgi:hypothetical protein
MRQLGVIPMPALTPSLRMGLVFSRGRFGFVFSQLLFQPNDFLGSFRIFYHSSRAESSRAESAFLSL